MNRTPTVVAAVVLAAALSAVPGLAQDEDPIAKTLEEKVTLNFLDTPLSSVLAYLQDRYALPIVLDPRIDDEAVTLNVKDIELANALRLILGIRDLAYTIDDGVLLISDRDRIDARRAVRRTYDVLDLITPVEDFPARELEPVEDDSLGAGAIFADESVAETLTLESLVEIIQGRIRPDSWESGNFSIAAVPDGLLAVHHVPEVQAEIETLLAGFREFGVRMVEIDARLYSVTRGEVEAVLAGGGLFLDAAGRARLEAAGRLLEQSTLVCFNSQRVNTWSVRGRTFLADYDVQVAQSAATADPIIGVVNEGQSVDVRPLIAPGGKEVVLQLRVGLTRMDGKGRQIVAGGLVAGSASNVETGSSESATLGSGGVIELLDTAGYDVKTQVRVPVGQGAVFLGSSALAGEDRVVVLVVTPRPVK